MNTLTGVMTMLGATPYLTAALVVTFGLLGLEAWIVRGQSRSRAGRGAEQ
ncbi:hypothetical protein [Paraburkholderia sp. HP33-1]|nr:hypothetical protein [Paraburkholderia sp. HP33-1]